MIIVKLTGGMGNQLFEYALGKTLSVKNNTELMFDISELNKKTSLIPTLRYFMLGVFNINASLVEPKTAKSFKKYRVRKGKLWAIYNLLIADSRKYVSEKSFGFDRSVLNSGNNVYLDGLWQSPKYFKDTEKILREEITPKEALSERSTHFLNLIKNEENPVSVHIRRADYVTNKATSNYIGALPFDYYERAFAFFSANNPKYFVFSDDMDWSKNKLNFLGEKAVFVETPENKDHEALFLMAECKGHIIANSSFSWWGAWLDPKADKKVVAPKEWFRAKKFDTSDLTPEGWMKI